MTTAGETFRALHEQPGPFVVPNPWDAGSARLLERLGFKALATTSAGMAFSLGLTDGSVPRDAVLDHCRMLAKATPLPVSADLEKGFGDDPQSVFDTITAAAATGLAGCSIEDHTGNRRAPIFDKPLAVERIAAAVEACGTLEADFVLTARCENLLWGRTDLDDVIDRLQAYEAAGADVLYAPALPDLDAIRTVCSALTKPVNVIMDTPGATYPLDVLAEAGVKRVSIGSAFAQLAYGSLVSAAREVSRDGSFDFTARAMDYFELDALFRNKP